jgi:hypothetical protein
MIFSSFHTRTRRICEHRQPWVAHHRARGSFVAAMLANIMHEEEELEEEVKMKMSTLSTNQLPTRVGLSL